MSNAVFPTLPGLAWSVMKTPMWSTITKKAVSGRQYRAANWVYPIYKFSLTYEFLRAGAAAELQQLLAFFNARQGAFDSFLFTDPTDCSVTDQVIGIGNGVAQTFQLTRNIGGYVEPITNPNVVTSVKVNGVVQAAGSYSVSGPALNGGVVSFNTPPPAGQVITWSGSFYFRVHFLNDSQDFENFMWNLWTAKKVEFESIK